MMACTFHLDLWQAYMMCMRKVTGAKGMSFMQLSKLFELTIVGEA